MRPTELRQLIRESINEYIREIDAAGTEAGLRAKMEATENAISKREKMAKMEGIDEAYHEMLDTRKMKELGGEVKALKKSLEKLKKQLDKLNSKGTKTEKPESEEKEEIVDEAFPESGGKLEENLDNEKYYAVAQQMKDEGNDSDSIVAKLEEMGLDDRNAEIIAMNIFKDETEKDMDIYEVLHMQKLAGIISETEYVDKVKKAKAKKALVKKKLNEFDMDQFSLGSTPKASFEDKWNSVPNANKEVLKKSTGKEPILIMASSKGSNYLIAKGSDSKFYLYTYTQAEKPGEPKGPFSSEEEAKKIVK